MALLKICYGDSRFSRRWKNSEISWEDLCERLSDTHVTSETVEEFKKLKSSEQDTIKDIGGFVGGHLRGERRRKDAVGCRSMLTLDMDYGTPGIIDDVELLSDHGFCVYSTHKHTPEKPRLRFIIPLKRDVTPDEYEAVARLAAADIGIDLFDDTTYEPNRLMYWPSTSADGIYEFRKVDGPPLDPDEYLSRYKDWKVIAGWPVSSREKVKDHKKAREQADPLTKKGIVGAFCRAYTVTEVIDKFLEGIYEPSAMEGRYDYVSADSSAGVMVYDDKFVYSFHATDPAHGRLLNAFDLLRIHRFGEKDEKAAEGTDTTKLPSWKAMCEFAAQDEKVKLQLAEDRAAEAADEFSGAADKDWQTALEIDRSGKIRDTLDNIVLIIRNDEGLQGIAFNEHRDGIDARDSLPWKQTKEGWNDTDAASLKVYLSKRYGVYAPTKTKDALVAVAAERTYHPIRQFLESLPEWDGTERVEELLIDFFGAEDTAYTRAVIRKTLIACVARIYEPGRKFDSVLILNGPQGIGKSTFFAKLGGKWFSDSLTLSDMKDKAGPEKLQGYWILELGELAGMKKMDVETVKSFVSRRDDKYRAAYGVNVESHPRQSVIVGSTNAEDGFLRDITGNRRFWPVKVSGKSEKKPWELTTDTVMQIWAETLVLYRKGEDLYLKGDEAEQAVEEQAAAMESDEREGLIREYLDTLLPEDWDQMDLAQRRNFLDGASVAGIGERGIKVRQKVCNMEIWCECFRRSEADMRKSDSYEISGIMKKIEGWEKSEGREPFRIYGRQRFYVRTR